MTQFSYYKVWLRISELHSNLGEILNFIKKNFITLMALCLIEKKIQLLNFLQENRVA